MIATLAFRNLVHDRLRLAVTLVGIAFSVVLMGAQLGLYYGSKRLITSMIDHANGELWIMSRGTQSFDDGMPLVGAAERSAALAVDGVRKVVPLVVGFCDWRRPDGGLAYVVVVGADVADGGLAPWNVVAGDVHDLGRDRAVAVDKAYAAELGIDGDARLPQIEGMSVRPLVHTSGIRSFSQSPYVFTGTQRARDYFEVGSDASTYLLVQLAPGTDVAAARKAIGARIGAGAEVLTTAEFRARTLEQWLGGTGAGAALLTGTLLGAIVGLAIVTQTLYASTKEYFREFATLRALGAAAGYVVRVILTQAAMICLAGFAIGFLGVMAITHASLHSTLPLVVTPGLAGWLLIGTLGLGAASSFAAIFTVLRTDPGIVFQR